MKSINSPNNQIILYTTENSAKAKKTLAYSSTYGLPISVINLKKVPITGTNVVTLAELLGKELHELADKENPFYNSYVGNSDDFEKEDWLKLFKNHPQILKSPIAVRGSKAMVINTPSDILKI